MKTTDEYKAAVANAIAFEHENPNENATTAARIHHVNPITVRSNLQREQLPKVKHGGQNKMFLDAQVEAIYKYAEDSNLSEYGATKAMVYTAIGCLKQTSSLQRNPLLALV